ncbi:carbohydrate porin [Enterobacter roggenkampii]|uniref:carbohydrate porin n=1 Tax=Enterobacter roggenkampii TaxID=1812935 RepID=UPI000A74B67F
MSTGVGSVHRPMLRFYVTGGKVDNARTARVNNTKDETLDDFNVGAMWEAWF